MIKFLTKFFLVATSFLLPVVSFAQESAAPAATGGGGGKTATQILDEVARLIELVIPILIGLALLIFIWGVFKYFISNNAKDKKDGMTFIIWGLISLFVMVSIWGMVRLLQQSFLGEGEFSNPPEEDVAMLKKVPETENTSIGGETGVLKVIKTIGDIITDIIPLIIIAGVLVLLWGIFKYAFGDSKSKETARTIIIWGIIALTVMAFVWAFVIMLQKSVFDDTDPASPGASEEAVTELTKDPKDEGGSSQNYGSTVGISKSIVAVTKLVNQAIPYLVSLGILFFLWGVFKYVNTDSAKIKSDAAAYMVWGIVILLIMGATWGFVNLFAESAGISTRQQPNIGEQRVSPQELIKR